MLTKLLDIAARPFYAIGYVYGFVLRLLRYAALAVQVGIEEGKGEHGITTENQG